MDQPQMGSYFSTYVPSPSNVAQQQPPAASPPPTPPPPQTSPPQQPFAAIDFRVWGPAYWNFLHVYSFCYPTTPTQAQKRDALALLHSVNTSLPCASCRSHFSQLMRDMQPQLESGASFSRWLVDAHNSVNRRLGKRTMTYDEAVRRYQSVDAMQSSSSSTQSSLRVALIVTVCFVVAIAIFALIFYANKSSTSTSAAEHRRRRNLTLTRL